MKGLVLFKLSLLICAILAIGACQESTAGKSSQTKLVITGSSTMAPLVADIAKRFEAKHPGIRVDVQTGGSSRGIKEVRSGLADIGMASRAVAANEQDLIGIPVARDGISIIVHESNPISSLTEEEIIAIYTGKITNWKSVGGPDARIVVVNKAEGRATLELFLDFFQLKIDAIKADVVIGENEQGIKTVAGNLHAIAYVSIGTAEYDATHGIPIKLLPLNDIPASMGSLQRGAFPLARPLTLVTNQRPSPLARRFLKFARSPKVHDLIAKHYFIPLSS